MTVLQGVREWNERFEAKEWRDVLGRIQSVVDEDRVRVVEDGGAGMISSAAATPMESLGMRMASASSSAPDLVLNKRRPTGLQSLRSLRTVSMSVNGDGDSDSLSMSSRARWDELEKGCITPLTPTPSGNMFAGGGFWEGDVREESGMNQDYIGYGNGNGNADYDEAIEEQDEDNDDEDTNNRQSRTSAFLTATLHPSHAQDHHHTPPPPPIIPITNPLYLSLRRTIHARALTLCATRLNIAPSPHARAHIHSQLTLADMITAARAVLELKHAAVAADTSAVIDVNLLKKLETAAKYEARLMQEFAIPQHVDLRDTDAWLNVGGVGALTVLDAQREAVAVQRRLRSVSEGGVIVGGVEVSGSTAKPGATTSKPSAGSSSKPSTTTTTSTSTTTPAGRPPPGPGIGLGITLSPPNSALELAWTTKLLSDYEAQLAAGIEYVSDIESRSTSNGSVGTRRSGSNGSDGLGDAGYEYSNFLRSIRREASSTSDLAETLDRESVSLSASFGSASASASGVSRGERRQSEASGASVGGFSGSGSVGRASLASRRSASSPVRKGAELHARTRSVSSTSGTGPGTGTGNGPGPGTVITLQRRSTKARSKDLSILSPFPEEGELEIQHQNQAENPHAIKTDSNTAKGQSYEHTGLQNEGVQDHLTSEHIGNDKVLKTRNRDVRRNGPSFNELMNWAEKIRRMDAVDGETAEAGDEEERGDERGDERNDDQTSDKTLGPGPQKQKKIPKIMKRGDPGYLVDNSVHPAFRNEQDYNRYEKPLPPCPVDDNDSSGRVRGVEGQENGDSEGEAEGDRETQTLTPTPTAQPTPTKPALQTPTKNTPASHLSDSASETTPSPTRGILQTAYSSLDSVIPLPVFSPLRTPRRGGLDRDEDEVSPLRVRKVRASGQSGDEVGRRGMGMGMRGGGSEENGDKEGGGEAGRPEDLGWVFVEDGESSNDPIPDAKDTANATRDPEDEWTAQLQTMRNLETARQQTQRDRYVDGIVGMASWTPARGEGSILNLDLGLGSDFDDEEGDE